MFLGLRIDKSGIYEELGSWVYGLFNEIKRKNCHCVSFPIYIYDPIDTKTVLLKFIQG